MTTPIIDTALMNQIHGPFGALFVLIVGMICMYKFFTKMLDKQEKKAEKRDKRFEELHESTLTQIQASTGAIKENTHTLELLVTKLTNLPIGKA